MKSKLQKEVVVDFMKWFNKQYGHYPTRDEFNNSKQAPCSVRTLERNFGGLVEIRKFLDITNPDHRTGNIRSMTASSAILNSRNEENDLYRFLCENIGRINIHRWEPYLDEIMKRSDFGIHFKDDHFFIDIFWASTRNTASGCLNIKLSKIPEGFTQKIYLVCTNKEIDIYNIVSNKKKNIPENVVIMDIEKLKEHILKICQE